MLQPVILSLLGALLVVGVVIAFALLIDRVRLPKDRRYLLLPVPFEVDDPEYATPFLNRILERIYETTSDELALKYRARAMAVLETWDQADLRCLQAERMLQRRIFTGRAAN